MIIFFFNGINMLLKKHVGAEIQPDPLHLN